MGFLRGRNCCNCVNSHCHKKCILLRIFNCVTQEIVCLSYLHNVETQVGCSSGIFMQNFDNFVSQIHVRFRSRFSAVRATKVFELVTATWLRIPTLPVKPRCLQTAFTFDTITIFLRTLFPSVEQFDFVVERKHLCSSS